LPSGPHPCPSPASGRGVQGKTPLLLAREGSKQTPLLLAGEVAPQARVRVRASAMPAYCPPPSPHLRAADHARQTPSQRAKALLHQHRRQGHRQRPHASLQMPRTFVQAVQRLPQVRNHRLPIGRPGLDPGADEGERRGRGNHLRFNALPACRPSRVGRGRHQESRAKQRPASLHATPSPPDHRAYPPDRPAEIATFRRFLTQTASENPRNRVTNSRRSVTARGNRRIGPCAVHVGTQPALSSPHVRCCTAAHRTRRRRPRGT